MNGTQERKQVPYQVIERLGVLGKTERGTLELRRVAWNGNEPRLDLRRWRQFPSGEERHGSGMALMEREWVALRAFCAGYDAAGRSVE